MRINPAISSRPRINALRVFLRYVAVFVCITLFGLLLLYAAGRVPQQKVRKGLLQSRPVLEEMYGGFHDGINPSILGFSRSNYWLDPDTEGKILQLSYQMDTEANPVNVLLNPMYTGDETFLQTVEDGQTDYADEDTTYYVRYWMGFRAFVRPLLSICDYLDIRQLFIWIVGLLCLGAALTLQKHVNWFAAMLFGICFLGAGGITISISIHYSMCFILAFAGIIAMPLTTREDRLLSGPMLLFILGALTQYFDFYSAPLVTCILPTVTHLLISQKKGGLQTPATSLARMGQCLLAWLAAYLGMWLCKLTLTQLFTNQPAFSSALKAVRFWMIHDATTPTYFHAKNALLMCGKSLLSYELIAFSIVAAGIWLILFCKNPAKRAGFLRSICYLVLGALPVLWIIMTTRPSITHFYFQYRTLSGTIMALGGFAVCSVLRTDANGALSQKPAITNDKTDKGA